MSPSFSFARVLALLLVLMLAACGNKGDLVRPPSQTPATPAPVAPPPLPDIGSH